MGGRQGPQELTAQDALRRAAAMDRSFPGTRFSVEATLKKISAAKRAAAAKEKLKAES